MSDAEYQGQQLVYFLDFRVPGADSKRIPVVDKLTVGSAADIEISVDDFGLAPQHGIFRVHNDILSLHNLAASDNSFIGKHPLIQGKMYILDKGDKVTLGDLNFIIRTEEIESNEDFKIAVANNESELSVDDILSISNNSEDKVEQSSKQSFFSKLMSKIKGIFVKKTLADEQSDMSLSSGITKQTKGQLLVSQSKKRKKNSGSSATKSINRVFFSKIDGAKTLHRLLAIVLNIVIFQSIYYIYIPRFKIQHHIDKATELALKYLALGMKEIIPLIPKDYTKYMDYLSNEKYINIVVIFLALELIGCLIFGVNIGQFLIGISTDGSFIVKRIKALVRSIIGLFTTPLLIFDIPALVGNKTLKELISASKIGYKSDSKKILGSYIFFPLFFSLLSLLPLLESFENLKRVTVLYQAPRIEKGKIIAYKASSKLLNANINISKFSNLLFIPELSINNKHSSSNITLIDLKKGTNATLSIEKMNSSYKQLIKIGLTGHPFASLMYPNLTSEQDSLLSEKAAIELENLMMNSFNLVPEEAFDILTEHGPFFIGISKLRKFILEKHFMRQPSKVSFIKKENRRFISLGDNSDLAIIYLLNPDYPIVARLNFHTKSASIGDKLFIATLKSTSLISREKQKKSSYVKKLKSQLKWDAFDTLDFYNYLATIPKEIDPLLLSRHRFYLKKLGKKSLTSGNNKVIKRHIQALKSTEKTLNKLGIANITSLKSSISEDITALNNRDLNYFDK